MRAVNTIAVTGHRGHHLPARAGHYIRSAIDEAADQYPGAIWLTGGATGSDQIATDVLLERGEHVELVLPFPPVVQGARWSRVQQAKLRDHLGRARAVNVLRSRYHPDGYRDRNRELVQRADLLVAFWNERPGSGTAMTVRMAERARIPIIVVPMY